MDMDCDTAETGTEKTEMLISKLNLSNYIQCDSCPNGHRCTPGLKNYPPIRRSKETQTETTANENDGDIHETLNKIKTLSRKELEEMITKCFIGTINSHADMKSLRVKCQELNKIKDRLFQKSVLLQKQVNDLSVAVRQMTDNNNRNPKLRGSSSTTAPIRFFRDIGFQVGIPDPKPTGQLFVSGPKYDRLVNMRQPSRRPKNKVDVDVDVEVIKQMKDITNDTVVLQNSTNSNNNANLVQNQVAVDSSKSKSTFISPVKVKQQQQQQKQPRNYSPVNNYLNISTGLMPPPRAPLSSRPRQVYIRQPRPAQQYVNNNLRQVLLQKQQLQQQQITQQKGKIENVDLDNIVEITETDQIITQNQGQLVYGANGELQLIPKPLEVDSQNVSQGQGLQQVVVGTSPRLQLVQQRTQQQQQPQTSQENFNRTSIYRILPKGSTVTTTAGIRTAIASTASGQLRQVNVIRMGQSTAGLQQHRFLHPASILRPKFSLPPFPLPPVALSQKNTSNKRGIHQLPPKPELILKAHEADSGVIVLSWNCTLGNNAEINIYQLYACQEAISENPNQQNPPLCTQWKSMGEVKALPLPMGCNISQISGNSKHHFIVRGIDVYNRAGEFSDPKSIILNRKV